jgi:heme/copper-type cytochrome/quinol oxidase subunit 2
MTILGASLGVLAQHGGQDSTGETIMTIFLATVLVVIWIALGVVCWVFWRAKKREDEAKAKAKETEWRSAPSS